MQHYVATLNDDVRSILSKMSRLQNTCLWLPSFLMKGNFNGLMAFISFLQGVIHMYMKKECCEPNVSNS